MKHIHAELMVQYAQDAICRAVVASVYGEEVKDV